MGHSRNCLSCLFCTPGAFPRFRGSQLSGWDIHCGFFDRRVTPTVGCAEHEWEGAEDVPLPLEH